MLEQLSRHESMAFRHLVVAMVLGCVMLFPTSSRAAEPGAPQELFTRMDAITIEINKILGKKFRDNRESHKAAHGGLVEYYGEAGNKPVWITEEGLSERAYAAMDEIAKSKPWGLQPSAYQMPAEPVSEDGGKLSIQAMAQLEVDMSYAILDFARHASGGRLEPSNLSENLDYKPPYKDPREFMEEAQSTSDITAVLRDLHPTHDQFLKLKAMLADIRDGNSSVPDIVLIPEGPTLRPGEAHPDVVLIRERLEVETAADVDPELFDNDVYEAVRSFQREKGLKADGFVGRRTRSAMNGKVVKPVDEEAAILSNMERWRWLPREMGEMHIHANIPEFMVRIRNGDRLLFEERVVTGKLQNKTPAFSDELERVVFNPYWYPPRSIIMNEIIPGAQRSPSSVGRQGLQLVNARGRVIDPYQIDWYSSQPLKYQVRQPPGRSNALGVVKFLFPNRHAVYMHDTPSKSLFNRDVRTFSHGCVRVRNPRQMAKVIMDEVQGWDRPKVDDVIARGANHKVELSRKVPVHVTYFTMWVDDEGNARHFKDIYGHDRRTIAALEGRPMSKEVNRKTPSARTFIRRQRQSAPSFFDALFDD